MTTKKKTTAKRKAAPVPKEKPPENPLDAFEAVEGTEKRWWHKTRCNYVCNFCPHATLDPSEARRHYFEFHAPASPQARRTGLVDRHGNEIVTKE